MKLRFLMWDGKGNIIISGKGKEEFLRYYSQLEPMMFWIDLEGYDEDDLRWLARQFMLHRLTLEDCLRRNQRPKIELYDGYIFTTLNLAYEDPTGDIEFEDIYMYISKRYVISLHPLPIHVIDDLFMDKEFKVELCEYDPDFIYHRLLQETFESYYPLFHILEEEFEVMEDQMYKGFEQNIRGQAFLRNLFKLRSNIITLEKFSNIQPTELENLLAREQDIISKEIRLYFRDILDNAYRLKSKLEYLKETSNNLLVIYTSSVNLVLQDIMKYLTIVTAIFAPATFVTGFFGMNFSAIPYHNSVLFWLSVLSMLLSVGLFIYWMYKRRWI